jgi:TolA-binding protein
MKVSELHPEEALDLYEQDGLAPRELEALNAHLARCPSCSAHVRWRADIRATLAEAGVGRAEEWRLAAGVLAAQSIRAPVQAEARPAGAGRRWMMAAAAVLAISLISGAASAKLWPAIERAWQRVSAPARSAPPVRPRPPRPTAVQHVPGSQKQEPLPPALPARATPPPVTSLSAATSPGRQLDGRAGRGGRARSAQALTETPAPTPPVTIDGSARPQPRAPAAQLFADVARARRSGSLGEARRAYGQLEALFSGSREERAASVLLGQLTLELGQPGDALARFERYLATDSDGALAEEARLGRALVLEQLGQPDDARRAWQELLRKHRRSVHAGRARARLESLQSQPRGGQDQPR